MWLCQRNHALLCCQFVFKLLFPFRVEGRVMSIRHEPHRGVSWQSATPVAHPLLALEQTMNNSKAKLFSIDTFAFQFFPYHERVAEAYFKQIEKHLLPPFHSFMRQHIKGKCFVCPINTPHVLRIALNGTWFVHFTYVASMALWSHFLSKRLIWMGRCHQVHRTLIKPGDISNTAYDCADSAGCPSFGLCCLISFRTPLRFARNVPQAPIWL